MKTLILALTACAALPALAQTQTRTAQVYRCGPEGRDLRDSPCPPGTAMAASGVAFDQPSAADSKAARERHLAEARQAGALAQARRASEAEARHLRSQAVGLQAAPAPAQPATAPAVTAIKPPKTAKPVKPANAASTAR